MSIDRDPPTLADILEAARTIQAHIADVDWSSFQVDQLRQDAVMLRIIIIGEATKRLSNEFRGQHPEVPWQQMAGMRDFLTHDYDKVIMERIWYTVTQSIPALIAQLEPLIPPKKSNE